MDFSALESVPDATVIVDRDDGRIVYVNEVAEQLFGYSRLELMGQPIERLVPSHLSEQHRRERVRYSEAPRRRPMGIGLELSGCKSDGQVFPVEISLAPMQVGSKTYIVAAVRDITERKKFERKVEQAREEVQRRDELLSVASHELRGPLGTVQLLAEILQQGATLSSEEIRKVVAKMSSLQRQMLHLTKLVDGLLDVSQLHLGRFQLKLQEHDLAKLTRDVAANMRDEAERVGSALTVRAEEPAIGHWDGVRLQQVITNLLGNAVKYGSGKPIEVRVDSTPATARVEVQDHGPGIHPEDQARIFELFGRAAAGGVAAGLGLGLYISRQIVEAHGGSLLLESHPGAGSTFTVDLPRAVPEPAA
jgi:protein-histidine pros-kinase